MAFPLRRQPSCPPGKPALSHRLGEIGVWLRLGRGADVPAQVAWRDADAPSPGLTPPSKAFPSKRDPLQACSSATNRAGTGLVSTLPVQPEDYTNLNHLRLCGSGECHGFPILPDPALIVRGPGDQAPWRKASAWPTWAFSGPRGWLGSGLKSWQGPDRVGL